MGGDDATVVVPEYSSPGRPLKGGPQERRDGGRVEAGIAGKKFGIDPRRYLRDTLVKILAGEKDLIALLPESYAVAAPRRDVAA